MLSDGCTVHADPCQLLLAALPAHQHQSGCNKAAEGQLSAMVFVLSTGWYCCPQSYFAIKEF